MASKFLDYTGLSTFWSKIKTWVSTAVTTNSPSTSKTVTGWNEGKITYGDIQIAQSQVNNLTTDLDSKAPIDSPNFTGTPTGPTAATGTDTTQLATTAFVNAEIAAKMGESDAMVYKGTIAGGSTSGYGALTPAADKGWTYKVTTAGKIDGVAVEVGDMLICNTDGTAAATASNYSTIKANWDFIQTNIDGAVVGPASATDAHVAVFDGATGKKIKDSGYTIGKSVPSNAEFTDTKVTAVGNHYTPAEDSTAQLDADASGATAAWSLDVVTGITIKRDAKGHVTGVAVDSGKIPANPNVDTKVTQSANNEDKEFPLLAKNSNNTTDETATSKYAGGVTVNPNKKQITATKFKGNLEGTADVAKAYDTTDTGTNSIAVALGTKADKVANATEGNFASLDANGNIADSGKNESNMSVLSASKLTTARNIDGVSFDGSAKIHHFGSCSTAAGTAAKTVTLDDSMTFTLEKGASVFVKFTNANSVANPTLAVNGTTAKAIMRYGTTAPSTSAKSSWQAGSVVHLVYDGTYWQMVGWLNDDSTYSNASLGQGYGTCSTAEATAAKVVTLSNYALATGGIVAVKFTYGLCASATMNVNSKGAKNIFINGAAVTATTAKMVKGGDIAYFIYDGTQYQFLGTDRMEKDAVTGFSDTGTAGTNAKVTYTKGDGSTGDLMVAITDAEINALT